MSTSTHPAAGLAPALPHPFPPAFAQPALPRHATLIPLFYAALLFAAGILLSRALYLQPAWLLVSLAPAAITALMAAGRAPRIAPVPIAILWITLGAWSAETELQPTTTREVTALSDGLIRTVEGTVTQAGPLRDPAPAASSDSDPTAWDTDMERSLERSNSRFQRIDLQLTAAEVVTDLRDSIDPIHQAANATLRIDLRWPQAPVDPIHCGEHLRLVLRMLPPEVFRDPGVWSRGAWLEDQGIAATASLNTAHVDSGEPRLVRLDTQGGQTADVQPSPPRATWPCLQSTLQQSAGSRLQSLPALTRHLPGFLRVSAADAALLAALIAGDRGFLTRNLRAGFETTGSFHLIVVSGLHLAILAGFVAALARRLRIPRLPATLLTLALTLAYALFTGFAIPAQRGFWMIAVYLLARLLYRRPNPLNVIGFATLSLLALSPRSLYDPSLQMTLLAVGAIAGIAVPLLDRTLRPVRESTQDLKLTLHDPQLPPRLAQLRVNLRIFAGALEQAFTAVLRTPRLASALAWTLVPTLLRVTIRVAELLFAGLIVECALALPMAIEFHRITVYALPTNLLLLPLLGLLVPAAMLLLLAIAALPAASSLLAIPAAICVGLLHLGLLLVRLTSRLPHSDLRIPPPTPPQIAAAIILLLAAAFLALKPPRSQSVRPKRRTGVRPLAALGATILAALITVYPHPIDHPAGALLFEAIDVGQGDCLLLITPGGHTLLIDAGGANYPAASAANTEVGDQVVSAALWARGIRRLDAVALTHAHGDHMGGIPAILRNFHPRELWVGNNPAVPAYQSVLAQAAALGIPVRTRHAGERMLLDDTEVRVLAPDSTYRPGGEPSNNDSLVLQARFGSTSVLLPGDAESPEEQSLLFHAESRQAQSQPSSDSTLASTVLKVGHHGSVTSTRPAFLAAVHPAWAVISCGCHNRFNHPRPEILAELQAARVLTLRTDLDGASCLVLDGRPGPRSVALQPGCTGPALPPPNL